MKSFKHVCCGVAAVTVFSLPLAGCGGGEGGSTPAGPEVGELEQFLLDNPEIAAEAEEEGPGEDEG